MSIAHCWDRLGGAIEEIDTPALLLDLDALERNIQRMAEFAASAGINLRPHGKAHKSPIIAHRQLDAGAIGICCQKVGEAEVMVAGGVHDVLVSNEVVGPAKLARLAGLARLARISVVVDSLEAGLALSDAVVAAGTNAGVLIDVDVGQERCGVAPGAAAVELAEKLRGRPGLELLGLQGYQGKLQHVEGHNARMAAAGSANDRLMETRALFEKSGLPLEIVTGGGTGTYEAEGRVAGMTEIQPGSYIFMDRHYCSIGGRAGPVFDDFEPSLTVLATVMSRPTADRVVLDAGLKALSNDCGPAEILDVIGWEHTPAGDEHGVLLRSGEGAPPRLGDVVRLLPSHCDTTVNLYDAYHVIRNGRLEAVWSIPGRGQIR